VVGAKIEGHAQPALQLAEDLQRGEAVPFVGGEHRLGEQVTDRLVEHVAEDVQHGGLDRGRIGHVSHHFVSS
jgi:hypothetical protein